MEQMNLKSRTETFKILFKLFAYLLFFLIVLASGVVSKLSLLTMVNAYKHPDQPDIYQARWGLLLCTALCVPYLLSFFACLQTVLFSSTDAKGSPKLLVTLWVLFAEAGQSLGVILMVFKVLPEVENITGVCLMSCVSLVPGVLKVIFSSRRDQTEFQRFLTISMDIVAVLLQISVWVVFFAVKKFDGHFTTESPNLAFVFNLILSTCLISLGQWENFTQVKYTSNRLSFFIQTQISDLRRHNAKIYLCVNAVKICVTFLFSYLLMSTGLKHEFKRFNEVLNLSEVKLGAYRLPKEDLFFTNSSVYEPIVIHVFSTAVSGLISFSFCRFYC